MILNDAYLLDLLAYTYSGIYGTEHPRKAIAEQLYAQMLGFTE